MNRTSAPGLFAKEIEPPFGGLGSMPSAFRFRADIRSAKRPHSSTAEHPIDNREIGVRLPVRVPGLKERRRKSESPRVVQKAERFPDMEEAPGANPGARTFGLPVKIRVVG